MSRPAAARACRPQQRSALSVFQHDDSHVVKPVECGLLGQGRMLDDVKAIDPGRQKDKTLKGDVACYYSHELTCASTTGTLLHLPRPVFYRVMAEHATRTRPYEALWDKFKSRTHTQWEDRENFGKTFIWNPEKPPAVHMAGMPPRPPPGSETNRPPQRSQTSRTHRIVPPGGVPRQCETPFTSGHYQGSPHAASSSERQNHEFTLQRPSTARVGGPIQPQRPSTARSMRSIGGSRCGSLALSCSFGSGSDSSVGGERRNKINKSAAMRDEAENKRQVIPTTPGLPMDYRPISAQAVRDLCRPARVMRESRTKAKYDLRKIPKEPGNFNFKLFSTRRA